MSQLSRHISDTTTFPNRPAFFVKRDTDAVNVTGNAVVYVVKFDRSIYDTTNSFNLGTGQYTIPVAGKYLFAAEISLLGISASQTTGLMRLVTSNFTFETNRLNYAAVRAPSNEVRIGFSFYDLLDVGDTAQIEVQVFAGTQTVTVDGSADPFALTSFQGALVT